MDHLEGAGLARGDRVDFDRRVRLEFRGAQISSDGGLLVMRELDDVLGLSNLASEALRDSRTGKNTLHRLDGLFRQSVFGRLAGYEDVNDADRLALDPVMRQVVGGRAVEAQAASASQIGRFETETLVLPGTGISTAPAITPSSCSTSLACWSAAPCVTAMSTAPMAGGMSLIPSLPDMLAATLVDASSGPTLPTRSPRSICGWKKPGSSTPSVCPPTPSCARRSRIG